MGNWTHSLPKAAQRCLFKMTNTIMPIFCGQLCFLWFQGIDISWPLVGASCGRTFWKNILKTGHEHRQASPNGCLPSPVASKCLPPTNPTHPSSCGHRAPDGTRRSRCTCSSQGCWCSRARSPHYNHFRIRRCLQESQRTKSIYQCISISFYQAINEQVVLKNLHIFQKEQKETIQLSQFGKIIQTDANCVWTPI